MNNSVKREQYNLEQLRQMVTATMLTYDHAAKVLQGINE